MKNLKQVLALGMAFSLTMSTMASAAFTDSADIKATEAVDMLTALGVIKGYEDGSFKPEGVVTRAEAAKMIFTIRNGGNDDASSWASLPTTFTDLNGYGWAEGYIKYCQSMGIIAGKSATKFDPGAPVTGVELAKMMLVTLGYNPETAGLTGAAWSNKTLGLAGENALLVDVNTNLAAGLPRQYAAQLLYNSVLAPTVVLRDGQYTNKDLLGKDNDTIGGKYMGLIETEVTLKGNDKLVSGLKDTETQVSVLAKVDNVVSVGDKTITYTVQNIESKIGENFNLLWKDTNNSKDLDKNDKVYGMYSSNTTTVVNVTANDIENGASGKVKIAGTEYELAKSGSIYKNYGVVSGDSWTDNASAGETKVEGLAAKNGDKVRVVLDDTNKIAAVYVISSDLYKVTAVSGTKVSIAGIGTVDTSKNGTSVYEGIAKDDVVAVTQLYKSSIDDATFMIEKAESVSGKLTAYSGTKTVTVDGTVYKVYGETNMKSGLTDDVITAMGTNDIDTTVTLYMVNGYVRAAQKTTEEAKQYAIVSDVDTTGELGSTFKTPKAELILADGTKKTVTLHKDSKIYSDNDVTNGTNTYKTETKLLTNLQKNQIVKYVEMSNGEYKIEEIGDYTDSASKKVYDKDTKTFDGIVTSGDCVLFYTDTNKELKAATIRSLNDITASTNDYAKVVKDGKVVAAFIDLNSKPSGATAATMYGIVTSDATTTNKDGDTYKMYTVATNDGDVSVYLSTGSLNKGDIVSFDKSSDDTYVDGDFEVYAGTGAGEGKPVAVTEYNDADKTITYATGMKLEGGAYIATTKDTKAVDKDVKISYINADGDKAGDAGFGVNEYDAVTGYANVLLVFENGNEATDKVVAIIVNTNGDTDVMGNKKPATDVGQQLPNTSNADAVNAALSGAAKSVVIDGDWTADKAVNVPDGKTLTVNGKLTLKAMPEGTGAVKATSVDATAATGSAASASDTELGKLFAISDTVAVDELTSSTTTLNNAKYVLTANKVSGALTVTDAKSVTVGTVTGALDVKVDGVTVADAQGNVTVADNKTLTVGKVNFSNTITTATNSTLVVTGDVATGTLGSALAGKTVFNGEVTGALTFDAASNVVFGKSIDIGTVIDGNNAQKTGAKITFKVAPTNLAITNNTTNGYFATATDGGTAETTVGNIKLDVVYTNKDNQNTSYNAWVPAE